MDLNGHLPWWSTLQSLPWLSYFLNDLSLSVKMQLHDGQAGGQIWSDFLARGSDPGFAQCLQYEHWTKMLGRGGAGKGWLWKLLGVPQAICSQKQSFNLALSTFFCFRCLSHRERTLEGLLLLVSAPCSTPHHLFSAFHLPLFPCSTLPRACTSILHGRKWGKLRIRTFSEFLSRGAL